MTTGPKDVSLAITEMLEDAIVLIDGYIDINGNGGPNDAMRASQLVKDALTLVATLARLEQARLPDK